MKVILVLMTILQIRLFWGSFTGLFKPHKIKMLELNDSMSVAKEKAENINISNDAIDGLVIGLMVVHTLFLTIYYILAGIYVNQIVFTILSCLFVIQS